MLVIVARATEVRSTSRLGPSRCYYVVGTRAVERPTAANDDRPVLAPVVERKEG